MTNLMINKKPLYLCNQIESEGRIIFSEPQKLNLNYQPLSMTGEIIAFGNEFIDRILIYTDLETAKKFKNYDRCYIYNEVPEEYDKFCTGADFFVDGEPLIYCNEATIYLQRMTGDRNG